MTRLDVLLFVLALLAGVLLITCAGQLGPALR